MGMLRVGGLGTLERIVARARSALGCPEAETPRDRLRISGSKPIPPSVPSLPFIVASAIRSGSTALGRTLDASTNGRCAIEPNPSLGREGRLLTEGLIDRQQVRSAVREHIVPRLRTNGRDGLTYGEKHVHYEAFLDLIHEECPCRIVHLHRDGRDVVRSMMDWHTGKFGDIYREAASSESMSNEALAAARAPGRRGHAPGAVLAQGAPGRAGVESSWVACRIL